ncbi:hypothetical protein V6N11_040143 [Hibiscus sabdariffa]|uniref:Uncharacterized protein n=1 Tax=Hibiscus sabdariffa TaxID=183260 RepID=A0ABR2RGK6_9ROSI
MEVKHFKVSHFAAFSVAPAPKPTQVWRMKMSVESVHCVSSVSAVGQSSSFLVDESSAKGDLVAGDLATELLQFLSLRILELGLMDVMLQLELELLREIFLAVKLVWLMVMVVLGLLMYLVMF